ncbi:hypothetical protein [Pelagibacterium lacus]|uniref:Right-handed parallel beta-helix repeat-containing protein n=1 Tax=Pelagibacterium lacus TaxID=2282655 RepID=A0A369W135_9HYPH|nr:hypothetical protein [Pelagibacterium lacus]RDE07595.1 hypothetical protein DVH29_15895 [Pelagibacterium lacus]
MVANPGKTYRGRRGRTWHFNTPFTLPSDVSLFLEGGRFRKMTNTPNNATAIALSDGFRGDLLALDIPEGVTIYRGIKVASDTEGGFEVIAQEQQNNRGSDLHQAIHVDGDRVKLHEMRAHRFDQAASLGTDAVRRYELRLESVDIRHYMRGLHLRSISEFWIKHYDIRSRSPNGTPDPGQNGILMGACTDGWLSSGGIFDAPEHGFRMGGPTGCERIFVSDLLCQRSGQCGFKIWTGSVGVTTKDISLGNIRCIDSGDDGDGLAFNDFGFMLQGIDRLQASGLTAMNRDLSVSALDSFYLSGLTNGHLDGVSSINPQRHGMHISQWNGDGIQPQSFNTNIITGYQSEMANTTGNHVHLFFRDGYDVRDLMMPNMSFVGGNNGVRFDASTGEFPQPSYFSAIGRSLAGSLYSGQSGLSNVKTVNLMS